MPAHNTAPILTPDTVETHLPLPRDPEFNFPKALYYRLQKRLSYDEIARLMKKSKSTVFHNLKPYERLIPDKETVESHETLHRPLLSAARFKALSYMLDDTKYIKAPLNNIAYTYKELDNSLRLADGKATSITEHTGVDIDVNILNVLNGK